MNALIIVDVQNDFCPGGALPVPEGNLVVPVINKLQPHFDLVVATQDWHPPDHSSFGDNGGIWPVHCVQSTPGAEFASQLDAARIRRVFQKGLDREIDSYSGFFDNDYRKATGLGEYLKEADVDVVYVCGLATDYCVQFTALDARQLGLKTTLIEDACRGVNVQPRDVERAVADMKAKGVLIARSSELNL